MPWFFNISDGTGSHVLKAETIFINQQIEHIKVTGEGISIVLQGNRPLLNAIELKKPINWKIIKGKLKDSNALERIIKGLEESLKSQNTSR
ncbi:MAG TPA: hypothetical protein VH396_01375 [Chitinophagaceae bacterium]|jgi:hypothetical protein